MVVLPEVNIPEMVTSYITSEEDKWTPQWWNIATEISSSPSICYKHQIWSIISNFFFLTKAEDRLTFNKCRKSLPVWLFYLRDNEIPGTRRGLVTDHVHASQLCSLLKAAFRITYTPGWRAHLCHHIPKPGARCFCHLGHILTLFGGSACFIQGLSSSIFF